MRAQTASILRVSVAATLVALTAVSLHVRWRLIDASLPYVGHVDEPFLSSNATRMLQERTLDPNFFRYPSLPLYLTAAGVMFGAAVSGTRIEDVDIYWSPYYSHPDVMVPARRMFAILSVATLVAVAVLGLFLGGAICGLLAPVVVALSAFYFWMSWSYLNVDVVATFLAVVSMAFLFARWDVTSWTSKVIAPGLLAAAAAASKYNAGLVVVPFALAVLIQCRDRRLLRMGALGACMLLAFLLFVPFSVFNFSRFAADVGAEIDHYRTGHPGFEGEPGLPQLHFYLRALLEEYGVPVVAFAVLGAFASLRLGWRRATVLLSLPMVTLLYMSSQRVHFLRNVLMVYVLTGLFAALGVQTVTRLATRAMPISLQPSLATVIVVLATVAMIWGAPKEALLSAYRPPRDSRLLATDWIRAELPRGSRIMLPSNLAIELGDIRDSYDIQEYVFEGGGLASLLTESREQDLYAIVPRFGYDPAHPDRKSTADKWNQELDSIAGTSGAKTLQLFGLGTFPIEHGFANNPRLAMMVLPPIE